MGLNLLGAAFSAIGRPGYGSVSFSQLFVNWAFQRVLRLNSEAPFSVHFTSNVMGGSRVRMGRGVEVSFAVSGSSQISVFEGTTLTIGDDTLWAAGFCVQTGNHDIMDRKVFHSASVVIGKNCWFGNKVTVLPGVTLGDNVTVGANSVVTKSFPSGVVLAGCPAKVIRTVS